MSWYGIATAPKDGTVFRAKKRVVARLGEPGRRPWTSYVLTRKTWWGKGSAYQGPIEGWCYNRRHPIVWEPTHWAPLANGPSTAVGE